MLCQSDQVVQGLRYGNLILPSTLRELHLLVSPRLGLVLLEYAKLLQEGQDPQQQVLLTPESDDPKTP